MNESRVFNFFHIYMSGVAVKEEEKEVVLHIMEKRKKIFNQNTQSLEQMFLLLYFFNGAVLEEILVGYLTASFYGNVTVRQPIVSCRFPSPRKAVLFMLGRGQPR